jgi:uncharacterized membrane protein
MSKYNIYFAYVGIMLIWNILIFAAPLLASEGNAGAASAIYKGFSPFCHQQAERSLCLIQSASGSQSIGDCVIAGPTTILNRYTSTDARGTAYEFGVCARDVAIYLAMLLGGIAYPFVQKKIDEDNTPPIWIFVLALIPIAIDGGTQLIGLRESTNTLRLITGAIAGFAVPFFLIPLLYYFLPVMKRALLGKK